MMRTLHNQLCARGGSRLSLQAVVMLALVSGFLGSGAFAQGERDAMAPLEVAVRGGDAWRPADEPLVVELSRALTPADGRIAVLLGTLDLTDLVRVENQELIYRPHVVPLPSGESQLVVFLVNRSGEWQEIGRSTLKVDRPSGLREVENTFSADLQGIAQFETGGAPQDEIPATFESAGARLAYTGLVAHRSFNLRTAIQVFGTTEVDQALRFSQRGKRADQFDLASYRARLERGSTFIELGHSRYGSHRHLISGFASRGLQFGARLGKRGEVRASLMNGSNVVGWDNPFGVNDSQHQILAGGLGLELLPERPGGLRIDLDLLDGSRRPLAGFNEGLINDSEENEAWGARVSARLASGRASVEAGWAQSDFTNPQDQLLAQGADLVPVEAEDRGARFFQLDLGVVRDRPMGERFTSNVDLSIRHERVEPQYRTVGAFVAADVEQNGADLSLGLGPVQIQVGGFESEDNLDEIPSILKTETKVRNANFALPLGAFLAEPSAWLPVLTYSYNRTHQFAAGQPINSGFNATNHLPDQVSVNQNIGLDWQGNGWSIGTMFNDSDQDNRQVGRDTADFLNRSYGLRFSWAPWADLDLGLDLTRDRATSVGDDRVDHNRQLGLNLLWRINDAMTVSGLASWTESEDDPQTALSDGFVANLEWAYRFAWREQERHGGSGQFFLRYGLQDFESEDRVFGFFFARDEWTLNAGFNLSLR